MLTPQTPNQLHDHAAILRQKAETYRRWAIVLFTADELDLAEAIMAEADTFTRKSRSLDRAAHHAARTENTRAA